MVGTPQQRQLGMLRLQCTAGVTHIFITEPVGGDHHHGGGGGVQLAGVNVDGTGAAHAVEHGLDGACLVFQHPLEMRLQPAVLAEQVVQIAVQEAVLPDQLKQGVHEEPCVFHITHTITGVEQFPQRMFVAVKQGVDQLVFGGVVVVEIAGADIQLGRYQRGGDIGLTEAVEQLQRDFQNPFCGAAWRLFHHGCLCPPVYVTPCAKTLTQDHDSSH